MKLALAVLLLFVTAHRVPAPISEIQTPSPAPEQSAKPKAKRKAKPTDTTEGVAKREVSSPTVKTKKTQTQSLFDGTWVGMFIGVPSNGNVQFTLTIIGAGAVVTESSTNFGSNTHRATCDGKTTRWYDGTSEWTASPNEDGRTAIVTVDYGGVFGIGAYHSSVLFRKTSP